MKHLNIEEFLIKKPVKKLQQIDITDVQKAREVIKDFVDQTPLKPAAQIATLGDTKLYFKFENQQVTGSFKIRGALNKMNSLSTEEKSHGVVASSAGNHAQGVALAAQKANVKAHIVMPTTAPIVKINATKSYGAEVILHGEVYDEAYQHARQLESEKNYTFVHPFEDEKIIAGQGTIGLEIFEKLPEIDSIVIPIGGGGLISGVATALKSLKPSIKVFGVVSNQAPNMRQLFKKEDLTEKQSKKISTIAEGIAIKNASPQMCETYISRLVDDIFEVSDDEIARAIVFLLEKSKSVTEGSGAAGLAAVLSHKIPLGKTSCVLLCGGNIDLNIVSKVIERGQRLAHRLARISVIVDDLPGNLSRLTNVLAERRANILEVYHDRVSPELGLRETRIDLLVETISNEHISEIEAQLKRTLGCRSVTSTRE